MHGKVKGQIRDTGMSNIVQAGCINERCESGHVQRPHCGTMACQ